MRKLLLALVTVCSLLVSPVVRGHEDAPQSSEPDQVTAARLFCHQTGARMAWGAMMFLSGAPRDPVEYTAPDVMELIAAVESGHLPTGLKGIPVAYEYFGDDKDALAQYIEAAQMGWDWAKELGDRGPKDLYAWHAVFASACEHELNTAPSPHTEEEDGPKVRKDEI